LTYLHLISGPRNISTALMYSFAQRSDTIVADEPFYACYLSKTKADHPGKDEVLKAQSLDEEMIKQNLFKQHEKPVLFIKNMAHHIEVLDDRFLSKCVNIFLIRNPKQIIASYAEVIDNPGMRDIGIEYEYHLFEKLKPYNPIVIDSGLVLENPESILKQVCARAELKFEKEMLCWPVGPKEYDGVWAPYWYSNVHRSIGFEKQSTSERELPDRLKPLCQKAIVYYEQLFQYALKPYSHAAEV
jgi:Sulfotransferase domain